MKDFLFEDTIVALATASGKSAIAVIRVSGKDTFNITDSIFINPKGKKIINQKSHSILFGNILDNNQQIIDEVLISIFRSPHSFTKEDSVEISCHGSLYIINTIIALLIKNGARLARPGEFTQRAFLGGRLNLAQAEAVADIIEAENKASHLVAINQMRGGFSLELKQLREELIYLASMLELELDFSEEDVKFADPAQLNNLVNNLLNLISKLLESFKQGNAIKNGITVSIVGNPNAGKSTLLNSILNDYKAIVSDVPGTTRDIIEDKVNLDGICFRFCDTAGLRTTQDKVEEIGIQLTKNKIKTSNIIIYVFDLTSQTYNEALRELEAINTLDTPIIIVGNKIDAIDQINLPLPQETPNLIFISAHQKADIEKLKQTIVNVAYSYNILTNNENLLTNIRHHTCLEKAKESIITVIETINNGGTNDLLIIDLKKTINILGEITGEITTEDILDSIFSKFCIGK
jgi:tRNA modification GTPase